jgi:hypothetical protein
METRKQRLEGGNSEAARTQVAAANGETELEPVSALMLVQLEFLLSCCKGLQSPAEDEIRTGDERIQLYQRISEDRTRVLAAGGMAVELARSMEQVIQGVVMLWPHELEIMEVIHSVLNTL